MRVVGLTLSQYRVAGLHIAQDQGSTLDPELLVLGQLLHGEGACCFCNDLRLGPVLHWAVQVESPGLSKRLWGLCSQHGAASTLTQ